MTRRRAFALVLALMVPANAMVVACSSEDATVPPPAKPDGSVTTLGDAAPEEDAADAALSDGTSTPFCERIDASSLVFCADFESTAAPRYGFDDIFTFPDASSLGVSDEGGIDHPSRVLDLSLTQAADGGSKSAYLSKAFPLANPPKPPKSYLHYEVETDFRVVGTASLPYVALSVLGFPAGAIKEHGFAVYDGNVFGRLVPKDFAVRDDKSLWHHARIVVDRGTSATAFATTINIDGVLVDNIGGVDVGASGIPVVRLGALETSPANKGSIRAQFDNVVMRRW